MGAEGTSHAVSTAGVAAQSSAWRGTFSASAAAVVEEEHGVCVVVVLQGVCVEVSTACCD
jgi:hypothetical protein